MNTLSKTQDEDVPQDEQSLTEIGNIFGDNNTQFEEVGIKRQPTLLDLMKAEKPVPIDGYDLKKSIPDMVLNDS